MGACGYTDILLRINFFVWKHKVLMISSVTFFCLFINKHLFISLFVFSVLNEDWTHKDLYDFQKGLSPLEQSLRWENMFN